MPKFIFIFLASLSTTGVYSQTLADSYQIDLLVFIHQQQLTTHSSDTAASWIAMRPTTKNSIRLRQETASSLDPYQLISLSNSSLISEARKLKMNAQYQILFHYSWLQPANSQKTVELPSVEREDWEVKGNIRVRQSNYYLMDAQLLFSATGYQQNNFVLNQKQRLKDNTLYYLDHPQAGMLIKIHKIKES